MHDPVRALWDELERLDCDPHGPEHAFRARCPAHDGDNRDALKVSEGAGGIALVTCFRGCAVPAIVGALGRPEAWLFPDYTPEPVRGRRRRRRRNVDALQATLGMLSLAGVRAIQARGPPLPDSDGYVPEREAFYVAERCPACDAPGLWIYPVSAREVVMACWSGCEQDRIREAARDRALSRA